MYVMYRMAFQKPKDIRGHLLEIYDYNKYFKTNPPKQIQTPDGIVLNVVTCIQTVEEAQRSEAMQRFYDLQIEQKDG